MKHIGLVGSRRRDTLKDLYATMDAFRGVWSVGDILISGGCPQGGDRFAEVIAITLADPDATIEASFALTAKDRRAAIKRLNAPIIIYDPDWDRFGRRAGFLRNTTIADKSDVLIAVVSADRTGGTEDTINKFVNRGKKPSLVLVL